MADLQEINYCYKRIRQDTPEDCKDFEKIWNIIIGYLISATAKDFTIIVRVLDYVSEDKATINKILNNPITLKNEKIMKFED